MQQHPSLRSLRIVALSFITVMIGASIAIWALDQTLDEIDTGLARTGEWVAGAVGIVGIVVAVMWRSRVVERP
ncbi:MAG: hypothetical protein OEM97_10185, partial [Acidimicrobiia bacterium]|nr:hypothetical protein [Acidimicrobiia bacterium]